MVLLSKYTHLFNTFCKERGVRFWPGPPHLFPGLLALNFPVAINLEPVLGFLVHIIPAYVLPSVLHVQLSTRVFQ